MKVQQLRGPLVNQLPSMFIENCIDALEIHICGALVTVASFILVVLCVLIRSSSFPMVLIYILISFLPFLPVSYGDLLSWF